jgi:hypothetical protein
MIEEAIVLKWASALGLLRCSVDGTSAFGAVEDMDSASTSAESV